ncbi:MAG: PKD domain-containing protein [Pirellulales bacterium]|nr:PKD domain-containing protein [Pirellulales bacterium]
MRIILISIIGFAIFQEISSEYASAQSFRKGGGEYNAQRTVTIPAGKSYSVVMTEFLHHGEIAPDGKNLMVVSQGKVVPSRVLQVGPGDFCRLAFQPIRGQNEYDILYGGKPSDEPPPAWTSTDGLLLETREFKRCNLNNFNAIREAFDSSKPIGADYVPAVHHAENPFTLKTEPFLSRYSGILNIPSSGKYGFMTSSQDASFLLIDGKLAVSAPGRHGPVHRAFRGSRQDIQLSAGPHKFEYYHAAAGPNATMVAAWEINPKDAKPQQPALIPAEHFRAERIGRLPANNLTLRTMKTAPDFAAVIGGDVPLPDNDLALVGVSFRDLSPRALSNQGKLQWDFGDGQTGDATRPEHVYLRPGIYAVKLTYRRAGKDAEIANKIEIDRTNLTRRESIQGQERGHSLDDYLKILETYDPKKLDAVSLRQLVLAFEAKSLNSENRPEEAKRYLKKAVQAGMAGFAADSAAAGDEELARLARIIGPMARIGLGDSAAALAIWKGAIERIKSPDLNAECRIAAADILITDLAKPAEAKPLLDAAAAHLGKARGGALDSAFERVFGDYYAAAGDGQSARKAYLAAEQALGKARNFIESTAWKGARSRSAEAFIKEQRFDRAAEELFSWQREFPTEAIEGYLNLLFCKFFIGRELYDAAVAQAERLQAVNADSAYVDQILLLAAECELRRGKQDRALATLHSILKDYPGSPLAPLVKKEIEMLEQGRRVRDEGREK